MFRGRSSSWNLRDRHMVETIENLVAHLDGSRQPKAIVWAHNSHLGDARATEMSHYGEVNVGQLMRERFGDEAALIGFSTHHGTVTAASDWGAPAERKNVRPALPGSYEELFRETGLPRFWIDLRSAGQIGVLQRRRIERAIGVIYRPESERLSHYFHARLPVQFEAVFHLDDTREEKQSARTLNKAGLATLLFDLLTPDEELIDVRTAELRFNIGLLAERLVHATRWAEKEQQTRDLRIGYFGSSTGGAAALVAAAEIPQDVGAVVSRGGRPDLAGEALPKVNAPTLLIVGGNDDIVIELNEQARDRMHCVVKREIIPGATHLFEEPGTLEKVAQLASDWFVKHISDAHSAVI